MTWPPASFLINELGALLMLALCVFVWRVRPGQAANRWFALAMGAWSAGLVVSNLEDGGLLARNAAIPVDVLSWLVSIGASIAFIRAFPTPLTRDAWRAFGPLRHVAWGAPVAVLALSLWMHLRIWDELAIDGLTSAQIALVAMAQDALFVTWVGAACVLALRFHHTQPELAAVRAQAALVAAALVLYPLFSDGWALLLFARETSDPLTAAAGLLWVLLELAPAALWLRASIHAHETAQARVARRVAFLFPLVVLIGMAWGVWLGSRDPGSGLRGGWGGAIRLVSVSLVAYAILKHQMFDIDLKVKWTLRQSSIAAVFLGVFFFVSEAATVFLGESTGSAYLGIAATTLLVFALAPLQRAADRFADAAMPRVRATPDYLDARKREIYRAALASALRDGVVTEKERDVLATLADELGLTAGEARALEREATRAD